MNESELLEYGIYHNILGRGAGHIPGIKSNGLIDIQYFENILSNRNKINSVGEINSWLSNDLPKWREKLKSTPLMLCSGGVDSTTLVSMLGGQNAYLIHTSYVRHDNNDLQKLCRLLDHFPLRVEINSISEKEYLAS